MVGVGDGVAATTMITGVGEAAGVVGLGGDVVGVGDDVGVGVGCAISPTA